MSILQNIHTKRFTGHFILDFGRNICDPVISVVYVSLGYLILPHKVSYWAPITTAITERLIFYPFWELVCKWKC